MTGPRKYPAFNFVMRPVLTRVLRRRFHNVYLAGGENLAALDAAAPWIGCVNHSNWWDGFVLYVLSQRSLPHDVYLAMEEGNLARYPFLGWMGAFGLGTNGGPAARAGLRRALRLLAQTAEGHAPALIWMFVQGALDPPQVPIAAKPGALFLARRTGAGLLPIVLRYEWLRESRPSIVIRAGAPIPAADADSAALAGTLNAMTARIGQDVQRDDLSAYDAWFKPRLSMNRQWDRAMHLLLRRPGKFQPEN